MTVKLRTKRPDKLLKQIVAALEKYQATHPQAQIEAYRSNNVSVRIRIVDPNFKSQSWADREDDVWAVLNELPDDTVAEVSLLLLLTPDEKKHSLANQEFEDPIPSEI